MDIRIIRPPNGEAPNWVREAWIGLSLPTVVKTRRSWRSLGVLSGPTNLALQLWAMITGKSMKVEGYLVNAKVAVDLLAETQAEAANWWREHAPELLTGKRNFVFDVEACEPEF